MDSSFCTSSLAKENHSCGVGTFVGKGASLRRCIVEIVVLMYRLVLKPALLAISGPYQQCKYPVSCSEFAKQQFIEQSFFVAFNNSVKRVISCNPWFQCKHPHNKDKE